MATLSDTALDGRGKPNKRDFLMRDVPILWGHHLQTAIQHGFRLSLIVLAALRAIHSILCPSACILLLGYAYLVHHADYNSTIAIIGMLVRKQ